MKFTGVTKEDSQVIQCLATNKHGSLWANMYLNVIALVPQIRPLPEDTKVAIGYSKTLTCNNNGKPTPQLAWYKGEQEQPLSGSRYMFTQNSITILNTTVDDEGTYRCTAKNSEGDASAQSQLYVRAKTSILTGPRSRKIRYGETVKFQCAAVTDPLERDFLTVKWMKKVGTKEEPVDLSDPAISVSDENELIITSTSSKHSGKYICVASNNIDSDKRTARLRVEAPPDPPINAKVPFCPGDEATITWEAGSNNFMPIKHYIINYKTSFDSKWRFLLQTNDNVTTVTTKLSAWVNYTFQVIAENKLGKSDPSLDANPTCTTSPQIPDHHPSGVKTLDDTTGYLVVTWDRMEKMEHNGPNFQYVVLVRKKGGVFQPYAITDWEETRKEIPVDDIYGEYEVVVKAKNARGEPLADALTFTGFSGQAEPLAVPQNFERDTSKEFSYKSVTFQWDRVDEDNVDIIRGRFRGYEIRYWKKDNPDKIKGILIDESRMGREKRAVPKKATAVVTNLPPFSDLQLDVVVRNDHFISNGSNVIDLRTPQGVPGPVENLRALGRSAVHITLKWEKPVISNGVIIRYDIGFQKVEGLDISPDVKMDRSLEIDPGSTQTHFKDYIDGLEPKTGYRIHVCAVTEAGKGKDMFIDVQTMAPGVPAIPVIEDVVAGKHSINVTWSMRPESDNAYIYYVEYRRMDSDFISSGKTEVLRNWQVVENLTSDTEYEVVVVASAHSDINAGQTARSERKMVHTLGKAVGIATAGPFFGAPWFIILMVLLALLILIIIIVCLVKRSRGDKYHVQEKEKLRGLDPEDRKAAHFNEFNDKKKKAIGRPYNLQTSFSGETQPLAGSPDEAEKGPLESDKDSLEEYGDVDPSRFNEDGSFIGQYGAQNTTASDIAPPTSAMHTFV
ncbi:hypothetical protein KUTeg_020639 [Tegillarca granosa]|uniref:Neuronal cell adhesion molecule n=1 Tax=Tegillarca granosa TaxID=220873 RepID=A0ABQ9ECQ1_TEGGR|nr:hypothetical protein KUTeg_020639 [Tegillarca granosa]